MRNFKLIFMERVTTVPLSCTMCLFVLNSHNPGHMFSCFPVTEMLKIFLKRSHNRFLKYYFQTWSDEALKFSYRCESGIVNYEKTIEITLTVPLIRLLLSRQRLKITSCICRLIIQNKGPLNVVCTELKSLVLNILYRYAVTQSKLLGSEV